MDAPVRTSVIVCTRNRAVSLARMLDSLCRCEPPRRAWELLVVDNGSSDATPHTLAGFASRLPLRVVHEPRVGLSAARNTGAAHARGEYLLWTDDDATVCRDWLRVYEAGFDAHPSAAFFAGPIRVRFEGAPPRWLEAGLAAVRTAFAGLELPEQRAPFDASTRRLPFGANLALRAVEQRAFRYDVTLGRHAERRFYGGEEVELLHRLIRSGARGIWLPEAPVEHWIDAARQTRGYLRRYYTGVGYVGKPGELANPTAMRLRRRLRYRLRIARLEAVHWIGRLLGRHAASLTALRDASNLRGRLIAQRERARVRPALPRAIESEPT